VRRACDAANANAMKDNETDAAGERVIPRWTPNQLRHTAATEIRRRFGLEAAQVCLGHSAANITQIYAERDSALGLEVMRQIG
jgi:integrase